MKFAEAYRAPKQKLRALAREDRERGRGPASQLTTELYSTNARVTKANAEYLRALSGDERRYEARDLGAVDASCPAKKILQVKVGAVVVLLRSIRPSAGLVNGAKGTVTKLHYASVMVMFEGGMEASIGEKILSSDVMEKYWLAVRRFHFALQRRSRFIAA